MFISFLPNEKDYNLAYNFKIIMLTPYHIQMLKESLQGRMSDRALEAITAANIRQDNLSGQFGHDEYHFDNNAFLKSIQYINDQRALVLTSLMTQRASMAWLGFGRLTHSAQDFYAHSNYISLWLDQFKGTPPAPAEVDALQKSLINGPDLRSGKIYFPGDFIYFIRPLRKLALKFLPRDSHGWMNLDSTEQGPKFDYAYAAAVKRTQHELKILKGLLTADMFKLFIDL